jgi:hypothetical protein
MKGTPIASRTALSWWVVLVAIGALVEIALAIWEWSGFATFEGLFQVHVAEMGAFMLGLLAFVVGLLGLASSFGFGWSGLRRPSFYLVFFPLGGLLSIVAATPVQTAMFKRHVATAVSRGDRLVAAIRSYEHEHSHRPDTVQDLVPRYLTQLPDTGVPVFPAFRYMPGTTDWSLSTPVSVRSGHFITFRSDQKYPPDVQRVGAWGLGISD